MFFNLRNVMDEAENAQVSDETGLFCEDKSKTRQSDADGADINLILERMKVGYEAPKNVRVPQYGDFEHVLNFDDAMNAIRAAEVSFGAMSGKVRAEFNNDPQRFLDFCEARDERGERVNLERMVKLGLAVAPTPVPEAPIMKVRVIPDPASGAS